MADSPAAVRRGYSFNRVTHSSVYMKSRIDLFVPAILFDNPLLNQLTSLQIM